MTVREYLDKRDKTLYGRKIRVIDPISRGGDHDWTYYADRIVTRISVSNKYIFIYVM